MLRKILNLVNKKLFNFRRNREMSTTATISRIVKYTNKGAKYQTIYVHWDGYLSGIGKKLLHYYTDESKIEELFKNGSMSSLGIRISPDQRFTHNFDHPQSCTCVFYFRDRGDDWSECKPWTYTVKQEKTACRHANGEYNYLFKDGRWYWRKGYWNSFNLLTDDAISSWDGY